MRTEFIEMFAELNAQELKSLTAHTKETTVDDSQAKNRKPGFTSANLWNIHNMRRIRQPRRAINF